MCCEAVRATRDSPNVRSNKRVCLASIGLQRRRGGWEEAYYHQHDVPIGPRPASFLPEVCFCRERGENYGNRHNSCIVGKVRKHLEACRRRKVLLGGGGGALLPHLGLLVAAATRLNATLEGSIGRALREHAEQMPPRRGLAQVWFFLKVTAEGVQTKHLISCARVRAVMPHRAICRSIKFGQSAHI